MDEPDIKRALDEWLGQPRPHHEWLAGAIAYISEAFRRRGLEVVLVGGGAIELHAPGAYVTGDADPTSSVIWASCWVGATTVERGMGHERSET